ncbi:MAG: sulfatase [Planctomycetota bacterium]
MRKILLAVVMFGALAIVMGAEPTQRPNILFILTDDQRWDALGCMGNTIIQTPNIDKLAGRGVLFRNHFVTTSICCVSRASILSGQYQRRHDIHDFAKPFTEAQWAKSYPKLLRSSGYQTGFIGKFGVGKDIAPMAKEFDYWKGLPGQAGAFFDKADTKHEHHITARFGDQALEFIQSTTSEKPFCLSISFSAPHARDGQPREFPPDMRDESLYANVTIPVPKLATDSAFKALPDFAQTSEGHKRWAARFATPEMYQKTTKDYYRLITGIDREVGRIIAELEARKLTENTIVIFTSDNGFFYGERGLADKWLMYEESIRVPLIVVDPRSPVEDRGRKSDAMTLNVDFGPTMLDYAGVAIPAEMQGRSLREVIQPGQHAWRNEFYYEHDTLPKIIPPTEGVRNATWSYIRWTGSNPVIEELYDIVKDPLEEKNLAKDSAHLKTLAELRTRCAAMRDELK